MGLFDKVFNKQKEEPSSTQAMDNSIEDIDGASLLDKHEKGLLDDVSFLRAFGKVMIYYSTPFGDHKDGGSRLFALPANDDTAYLPVFSSSSRTMEFYEKVGRCGYLIIEGTFASFLETTKSINEGGAPVKLGAIIDPDYYGVTINANALDAVIDLIK